METVNQETNQVQEEPRTFTQEELDRIVGERLQRERAKYADFEALKEKAAKFDEAEEASKSELQKATERADSLQKQLDAIVTANKERELRERIASETGVPVGALRGNTEEDLRAQAEVIKGFASKPTYPTVKDGGEAHPPTVSKEDILAIKDEQKRLDAIRQNIELFT